MSAGAVATKSVTTRLTQLTALIGFFGLLWLGTRVVPEFHGTGTLIGALGFLLLAGTLASELCEILSLPHLTGYILAGVIAGPYVTGLIEHETAQQLSVVNTLALALIALAGGAELRLEQLRTGLRSLVSATIAQALVVILVMTVVFAALSRFIPFARDLGTLGVLAVALLWGVLAVSRSPSATLAIFSQTRARGPVSRFTLAFVMSSDVVVLVLLAVVMMITRQLLDPSAQMSIEDFAALGHELLGSVALGTTLGIVLALYLRLIGTSLLVVLIVLGYGLSEGLRYLHFDPLLTLLLAGFVVQNFSRQGTKLLHAVEQTSAIVFVVFFASAGAHLDIPLLRQLWPMALALAAARAVATLVAHRIGARWAGDPPEVRRYGWAGLISQAGLTLGLAAMVAKVFPTFGPAFGSLCVATVAVNEVAGPILFKAALDRSGETASAPASRASDASP